MKRPKLTLKAVVKPRAVDEVLTRSSKHRILNRAILRLQRRLRKAVDPDAWRIYLLLDEIVNERAEHEHALLVQWAFEEGARRRR